MEAPPFHNSILLRYKFKSVTITVYFFPSSVLRGGEIAFHNFLKTCASTQLPEIYQNLMNSGTTINRGSSTHGSSSKFHFWFGKSNLHR